ncbi:winged helix-turn-helix transcriptional regulator [Amycolatopsis acidiphila]|uniref:Winged helix-turn-helix transcriptional regulator n=1 Tax=Amycolatopsis acidiphila TaxID=715473 RepID=A0A558A6C8_9PSEU|nr:winged helix-turn-helix transcriptional regulator [Amycolatopsis acidiphila]
MYEQVAAHIQARIRSGELQPNQPLPAELRLAQEYGVSLGTARHAVRLLRYRGLVQVIRSKGTYISRLDAFQVPGLGSEEALPNSVDDCQWL